MLLKNSLNLNALALILAAILIFTGVFLIQQGLETENNGENPTIASDILETDQVTDREEGTEETLPEEEERDRIPLWWGVVILLLMFIGAKGSNWLWPRKDDKK